MDVREREGVGDPGIQREREEGKEREITINNK